MTISRADSSRINGSQSSGPVTDEGRAASSQNALKLGIYAKRRFISGEKPEDYAALLDELSRCFNPGSSIEWMLLDRMAMARWKLARLERGEAATIELAQSRYLYASDQEKWERYGGRGLVIRLPQVAPEALKETAPERDRLINASLGVPEDLEKFIRISAALNREFDAALRSLREEQARRIGALEIQRPLTRKCTNTPSADSEVVDGEVED